MPSGSVESGVEGTVGNLRFVHGNALRQMGVHAANPCRERPVGAAVEVDDLCGGVNAGVGAAGGNHADGFAGNLRQRVFQSSLHRCHAFGLLLPAEKAAAVISQRQRIARGGLCLHAYRCLARW